MSAKKFIPITVVFIGKLLDTDKTIAHRETINLHPEQIGKEGPEKKALRLMRKRFPKTLYEVKQLFVVKK